MTSEEFNISWSSVDDNLSRLSPELLERFNLTQATFEFLTTTGLPKFASPDLYFAQNTDDQIDGIYKLTEIEDYKDIQKKHENYVIIGHCRDGDLIAIDTSKNDQILELYTCSYEESMFFNSSISTLADFLILYRDFEKEVLTDKTGDEYFQCWNFTNDQFRILKDKMKAIDKKAIIEEGYWKEQLEMILALRKEYFGKK